MSAKKNNQAAFENAVRDKLSSAGIAAIIALLQTASNYRNDTPVNQQAIDQVEWFHQTLLEMIGVAEFNRLVDEIGM